MNGWQRFVPPKPRPSSVPRAPAPPRLRRHSKREVRDRRLLAKLAAFVKSLHWWPSAPELAARLGRNRTTVWRGLNRLRRAGLLRMERRAWQVTDAGWNTLNRDPVRALIDRRPRARKARVAAVRCAIFQRRFDAHRVYAVPAAAEWLARQELAAVE